MHEYASCTSQYKCVWKFVLCSSVIKSKTRQHGIFGPGTDPTSLLILLL